MAQLGPDYQFIETLICSLGHLAGSFVPEGIFYCMKEKKRRTIGKRADPGHMPGPVHEPPHKEA